MALALAGSERRFPLTPHKTAVCALAHLYISPPEVSSPFGRLESSQRQRVGFFLLSLTTACDSFLEPPLAEFILQLKVATGEMGEELAEQLTSWLQSFTSAEHLFQFFFGLKDVLAASDDDDSTTRRLCPTSVLGQFVRRCILSFHLLAFEGLCRLLANLQTYCRRATTGSFPKGSAEDDDEGDKVIVNIDESDLEGGEFESAEHLTVGETKLRKRLSHHLHVSGPYALLGEGSSESAAFPDLVGTRSSKAESSSQDGFVFGFGDVTRGDDSQETLFLQSYGQVDGYLREQADLIEKQIGLFPMNEFEAKLDRLEKLAPELSRVHYLRYLNRLYHLDYPAALDSLHRYFDYSAGMEGPSNNGASSGRFQGVLLSMAIMHSRFGHSSRALEALTEAVQLAQQNNDDICIAHALAAICYLFSDVGVVSDTGIIDSTVPLGVDIGARSSLAVQHLPILLRKSLKRSKDLKLAHLVAFNCLALAKFDLKHVRRSSLSFGLKVSTKLRTFPIDVCKGLRLSYVLSEAEMDSTTMVTGGPLSDLSGIPLNRPDHHALGISRKHGPISGAILQSEGMSYLLKATSWELYGSAPLVRMNALVHATCYADVASVNDLSLAYVKLIQHLAMFKGYEEAFSALKKLEKKFSSDYKSHIQLLKLQLIHDRALHRGEIKLAQIVCHQFGALASPVSGVDMELKTEASLRRARTLLAADQFSEAVLVAQSLFCTCYKFNMQVESTGVLLLLAEIHKKSGNAIAGLPYVLACLSLCQSFNLDLLQAAAIVTLAELLLNLGVGHAKRALVLLYQSLPIILGHGGLELRARANLTIAKCHLSIPGFSVCEEPDIVLDPLRQAAEEFQILEYHELAGEAFYLIAVIFNALGNHKERDIAASSFQKHVHAQNQAQNREPDVSVL